MSLSFTNSSSHSCSSRLSLQNNTVLNNPSNHSSDLLQQFVHCQAAIFGPPVVTALSNWAWSLVPATAPLSSMNVTQGLNIARNTAADVAGQLIHAIGGVFSYLTQNKKESSPVSNNALSVTLTPSCALGLLALGSGSPAIQLGGIGLLTDCLKFPGVKATQGNGTFLTTLGGTGNDYASSVQQTLDGGFIVTGYTNSVGAGNNDAYLTKFASNGTVSWTKTVGGIGDDKVFSVQQTQDGGYIVSGYTISFGIGNYDVLLLKFLTDGTLAWAKTLGNTNDENGYSVKQTQDGGYIVTGATDEGAGAGDLFLAKITSAGALSWTKTLGGTGFDYGNSVQQTQDGGFIVVGSTGSFGAGNDDILLAKFTSTGTLSWTKTLGGGSNDLGYSVQQTQDGGYIVSGYTASFGAGGNDALLAKFTSTGTLSWAKTLGGTGSDYGYSVQQTSDGGYIVTGALTGFGVGGLDVLLSKFSLTGTLSWAKILGGSGSDIGYSIQKTQDGGFIVSGTTTSFGSVGNNILLAKLDSQGRVLNCNAMQSINPTVTDISGSVTVTSPSPTVTSPSPTVSNWAVSAIGQTLGQNMPCQGETRTRTRSLPIPETPTFLTTLGGMGTEYAFSVQQTQDGGFILAGYTDSVGVGSQDILLTKFASNGTVSWTKTLGGVGGEQAFSIQKTQDGGFVVTGYTNSFGAGGEDGFVFKFLTDGTLSWAKTFGGPNTDMGYFVQQTQDGGFIVSGYTYSFGAGGADVILAKFTSTGTLSWTKTLGGTGSDYGQCVQQTQDGGYILTGGVSGFGIGTLDILLAKFTSIGTLSWAKTLGGTSIENGLSVQQTQDGGYIVTGYTGSFGAGADDVLLAKFSSSGSLSWAKTLGGTGSDVGNSVQETADGGFIITGAVTGFGIGGADVLIAKFSSGGTLSWAKILGGTGSDTASSIQKTQDGGFVLAGSSTSFGSGGNDILLAKLDSQGRVLNCKAMQSINPTVTDITGLVTVTSPSPTVTSPSPTVSNWAVSAIGQTLSQNMACIGETRTRTPSLPIPPLPTFLTTVGGTGADYGTSVAQTQDGGFIVTAVTNSLGAGSDDFLLSKFASNGTLSWTKTVGGVGDDRAYSVQLTQDGGYIVTGHTYSAGAGISDAFLAKFTSTGTLSWAKTLGGALNEGGLSAQQTQDGGYFLAGGIASLGAGGNDFLLAKFTSSGTLSWAKTLGGANSEYINSAMQTQDGGFIVLGPTNTFGAGPDNILLAKFTSTGTLSWTKTLGGLANENGYAVQQTLDGGYIVTGYTDSFGAGGADVLLAKFTSTGTLSWAKTLGGAGSDVGNSVQETGDGGFIITGSVTGFGRGNSDLLIAKFTSTGTLSWAKILGGTGDEVGNSIQKTQDGGFVVGGFTNSFGSVGNHILLAKLDSNGHISHCNAVQSINPTVTDITGSITVTSPSPTVTSPSPTLSNWVVSAMAQNLNQTLICPRNTRTASGTMDRSRTFSPSNQESASASGSRLSKSQSRSFLDSSSYSAFKSQSFSPSEQVSASYSSSASKSQSKKPTESLSHEILKTRTNQATRTRPTRSSTSVIIEQFNLSIPGLTDFHIAPSGTLVLAQTATGFELVNVNRDYKLILSGKFATTGTIQATTFSLDEQYVFIATTGGNIQVIDIRDPNMPKSVGFVNMGSSIQSLGVSGSGRELLVGTSSGIRVVSAKTPAVLKTMTLLGFYATPSAVTSIQTNPNTNTVAIGSGNSVSLFNFIDNQFTKLDEKTFSSSVRAISPIDQVNPSQLTVDLTNGDTVFVDIEDPSAAIVTATIPPASPTELDTISGSTLLLAGAKPGIQIFENEKKNWDMMREVGYSPITETVTNLEFATNGKFAVYSDAQGLKLIKIIKDPGRLDVPLPKLQNVVKLGFPISHLLINEPNRWIALGGDRLTFISADRLEMPKQLGSLNTTGSVKQMVFFPDQTKMLFVDDAGVACVDCYNPERPQILGRWNSTKPIYDLSLSGSYAYVSQGEEGISVLDIKNPLNIVKTTQIETQGAAQTMQFNRDRTLAYIGDSAGIDIWKKKTSLSFDRIGRLNTTGFVSHIRLSPDEKTLYFASEQLFGKVNVSDASNPTLLVRLDARYPIKDIAISNQGNVAYLAAEINGMLLVDTEDMQVKGGLPSTKANAIYLNEYEDQIYVADLDGGMKVADLITQLPIIPLTARTSYPVGIQVEEKLLFFNQKLEPIAIDQINSIKYVDHGQRQDLSQWISADLKQHKLFITAPKELSGQPIQLAISLDANGVRQETLYQSQIASSLEINNYKGAISITTPSPTVSVDVNLTQGSFIPQVTGAVSVSTKDNTLKAFGPVSDINQYLRSIRINPSPITRPQSAVSLSPAQIRAADLVNLFPSNAVVRLRSFRFNEQPTVNNTMNQTNKKALSSFEVTVPTDTFTDPDDLKLILSAKLSNGTALPSWLTFNPETATFNGYAPISMLNQTLPITLTASDGYLSVNSTWELHIDGNRGPFVAKPIPSFTSTTGTEFSYAIPQDIFQDLDNNTLTYSAVQVGYDVLPGFLNFDPATLTFLGRPTADDVKTYPIKITATDEFGASAVAILDLDIKYSKWDLFLAGLEKFGIASAVATPFTWAYYNRAFLYNTGKRETYWRDEIPGELLQGKGYKPKHPSTSKEIEKDEIVKIQVMAFDKEKCGHDFAKDKLPIHFYVTLWANALLNEEPLPTWLELDPDTGTLLMKPDHFPVGNNTYIFQVIGKDDFILESFFIEPSQISMYQAPINLTEIPSLNLEDSIELQPRGPSDAIAPSARPEAAFPINLDDIDLSELLNQRPGNATPPEKIAPQEQPKRVSPNTWIDLELEEFFNERKGNDQTHLLDDDDDNARPARVSTNMDMSRSSENKQVKEK